MPSSRRSDRTTRLNASGGQAAVEFVIVLPLVVVMALGLLVVGIAIRNELAVEHAAREGARAASVSATPSVAAGAAARRSVALPVEVSAVSDRSTVTVTVRYVDPVDVAIVGSLIGPITHTASVTMALEPP
jgi:Flp pilus assembly protein TadG